MGFALLALVLAFALKSVGGLAILVGFLLLMLMATVRWSWWIWLGVGVLLAGLSVTDAGVPVLRILAIILPTPVLAAATPAGDLVRSLQALRLPPGVVLGVVLIWRFLPLIRQEAERILEANLLRGIDLKRQPKLAFNGLFVPLIFRMVSYADDVTVGLETRGYDPTAPRSVATPWVWGWVDGLFAGVAGLVVGLALWQG